MNFRNLKLHTATNLFATIILAMLLINCIIAIFWYEHLIKQHCTILQNTITRNYTEIETIITSKNIASRHQLESLIGFNFFRITTITHNNTITPIQDLKIVLPNEKLFDYVPTKAVASSQKDIRLLPPFFHKNRNFDISVTPFTDSNTTLSINVQMDTSSLLLEIWKKEKVILLYIIFNAFILTTILFFRFRKTVFTPIDNLLNVANSYQLHDGIWTIQPTKSGEFDQLSQAMNAMVLRIEKDRDKLLENVQQLKETNKDLKLAQQETIQAEKLASTGRLAAGFAHEIGNPVTIIQGYLELLKQNTFSENDKCDFLNRSLAELKRIDSLLFQLMDLASNKKENECSISPVVICDELATTLQSTLSRNNIDVSLDTTNTSLYIFCDPELFRQIMLNLFLNSIDAILAQKSSGSIHCAFKSKYLNDTQYVLIQFEDNGIGIENDNIDMIFDPFFTTKPVGEGTGLGLSVVRRIIKSLNGHVEVQSHPSKGTTLRLFIPQHSKDNLNE